MKLGKILPLIISTVLFASEGTLKSSHEELIAINFNNMSINQFVKLIEKVTKNKILIKAKIDESIRFKGSKKVKLSEVTTLANSMLRSKGYSLVNHGSLLEVVNFNKEENRTKRVKKVTTLDNEASKKSIIEKNRVSSKKNNNSKNIDIQAYYEEKKLKGFIVNYINPNSEFSHLGLKRGDIIVKINGEDLKESNILLRIFNNLDSLSTVTITVKRGNETKELEYEVR